MPGPAPTDRVPAEATRLRRLQTTQNDFVDFVAAGSVIQIDVDGFLQVILKSDGGLVNTAGELGILLDSAGEDFLVLSSAGLNVDEGELYSFAAYYG